MITPFLTGSRRIPVVLQNELAECGLACLAMIACHHGHDVDLASLRRRFPVSLHGASLARLIDVAAQLGLDARPLRVELEYLTRLRLPCIVHWDLNHFVVLVRVHGDMVELHDPARGAVRMPVAEFSRHFTGIALELTPAAGFAPQVERRRPSLRALVGHVQGLYSALGRVLLLALALELFTLTLPLAVQWVLDQVLVSADTGLLTLIGLGFLAVVTLQALLSAMRGVMLADIGAALNAQWTSNLFGHLLRLPLAYFEKRSVGGVLSRFLSLQIVQQTVTGSFVEALLDGLTVLLVLALLLAYSPLLTLVVIGGFALYALLRWLAYRRLWLLKDEQMGHLARQQSVLIESVHGIQTLKLANLQPLRQARLANATVDVTNREAAVGRITAVFGGLSKLVFGAQRIVLIWIAARMVLAGSLSAGMLVAFIAYAELFAARTAALIDRVVELRLLSVHAQRIADVAMEPPEAHVHTGYAGPEPAAELVLENVSFRYADDDPWVLQDLSLRIAPGESVAITGPSGSGKTTLAKLILGLLQPQEGRILLGGIDIRHLGLASYRERVAAVMQDDTLFAGSVAANISAFASDARQEDIERAARAAHIHDTLVRMPMGYESLVGDMGSALSGGQKQRVLLARALYRKPDILLLDEATSHLDVELEQAINVAIAGLAITRIIIAHRPDTIRSADRVIALQDHLHSHTTKAGENA